jgi:hypothetical protein
VRRWVVGLGLGVLAVPSVAQGFECVWAGVTGGVTSAPVGHWTRPAGYTMRSWADSWDVKIDKLPAVQSYWTGSLISSGSGDYAGSTAVFFPAWPSIGSSWSGTLRFRWGLYRSTSYREDFRQEYTVVNGVVQMPTPVLGITGPASGWGLVNLTVTGNAYVTGPVSLGYSGGASGPSSVTLTGGTATVAVSLPRRVTSVGVAAAFAGAVTASHTVSVTLASATLGESVEVGVLNAGAEVVDTVGPLILALFIMLVVCLLVWIVGNSLHRYWRGDYIIGSREAKVWSGLGAAGRAVGRGARGALVAWAGSGPKRKRSASGPRQTVAQRREARGEIRDRNRSKRADTKAGIVRGSTFGGRGGLG